MSIMLIFTAMGIGLILLKSKFKFDNPINRHMDN